MAFMVLKLLIDNNKLLFNLEYKKILECQKSCIVNMRVKIVKRHF